jgi:electron transport complex protein RnfG
MSQEKSPNTPAVSSARLVLTLALAGLISGAAIIGIYEVTLPTITINKARELREAVFKVIPGVTQMQQLVYRDGELIFAAETRKDEQPVYAGYDDEDIFVGYAIPAAGPGFQDTIGLLYGFRPDRQLVTGMEVLESRETPGLGDKIYKDADFVASFKALLIEPEIVVVKKGKKSRPNEVDAITGATISSKAVVRIINETHAEWSERLPPAGSEPAFVETEPADTGEGP